jgi:hypothetical protein
MLSQFDRYSFTDTYFRTLNGCETVTSQFHINVASGQIVDNDHVVALITQIKSRGPSAKAVAAQDNDLLFGRTRTGAVGSAVGGILGRKQSRLASDTAAASDKGKGIVRRRRRNTLDRSNKGRATHHKDGADNKAKLHHTRGRLRRV